MKISNYINGRLVAPTSGNYLNNINPATGMVYGKIPDSNARDVAKAVQAAEKAFPNWSTCGSAKRANYLNSIAQKIKQQAKKLALAESIDNGKPLTLATSVDIPRAESNFHFFASAIEQFASESHYMEDIPAINYTLRKPIGVVGCISPWNLPLYLFTWKIAPALAAGNCVVAKPSEVTPATAFLLAKICIEVGLPKGVLNIVHGLGPTAGQAIIEHPNVKAISFTGGTATGKRIAATAAPMFKKLSLELGGKNPNIIFADCDIDQAVSTSVRSSFANQGQICLCGSRIYIQEEIYSKFKRAFLKKIRALKLGDPLSRSTQVGAVVSEGHMHKVLNHIAIAKKEGGKVLTGGKRIKLKGKNKNGFFIEPTVIESLDHLCQTNQEEIFGPVVTLTSFKTEDEVLEYANSTPYGLSSTIWTDDLNKAHRVANKIESGIVWINCWLLRDLRTPFGGIKNSGVGREGGLEVLRFFTEPKNVCIKY